MGGGPSGIGHCLARIQAPTPNKRKTKYLCCCQKLQKHEKRGISFMKFLREKRTLAKIIRNL